MRTAIILLLLGLQYGAWAEPILLLSDNKPSITGVAQAIAAEYKGKVETYNLEGDRARVAEIAAAIRKSDNSQVVAVGLLAAQAARQYLSTKQVVFCQVLNYEEFDLVTPWMKGVSAIPSLSRLFEAWKLLNPKVHRIGVIASKSMTLMLDEARRAANENGLELVYAEAESDRQMMLALSSLNGQIDGLWLAPDSHILGSRGIFDVMAFSVKHNIQMLVFSPVLLKEGGLLSGSSDWEEIAHLVVSRLQHSRMAVSEGVTPLNSATLDINARAAEQFGLTIPDKLRKVAHVE